MVLNFSRTRYNLKFKIKFSQRTLGEAGVKLQVLVGDNSLSRAETATRNYLLGVNLTLATRLCAL